MSTHIKVDCKELKALSARLKRETEYIQFLEGLARDLAMILLEKVKMRTPVGVYPAGQGKTGGTLRRGWTIGNVKKIGGVYEIELFTNVPYAPHVEFGHRTRGGKGYVTGRFMLTISEAELQVQSVAFLERRIAKKLREIFDGK